MVITVDMINQFTTRSYQLRFEVRLDCIRGVEFIFGKLGYKRIINANYLYMVGKKYMYMPDTSYHNTVRHISSDIYSHIMQTARDVFGVMDRFDSTGNDYALIMTLLI